MIRSHLLLLSLCVSQIWSFDICLDSMQLVCLLFSFQIIAVNGVSLLNLHYDESLKLLQNTGKMVELIVSQIFHRSQHAQRQQTGHNSSCNGYADVDGTKCENELLMRNRNNTVNNNSDRTSTSKSMRPISDNDDCSTKPKRTTNRYKQQTNSRVYSANSEENLEAAKCSKMMAEPSSHNAQSKKMDMGHLIAAKSMPDLPKVNFNR